MSPVIAAVIAVVVGAICGFLGYTYRKNFTEKKIERTEDYAKRLYDDAVRKAEDYKKEKVLEAKEEILKAKAENDRERAENEREIRERRNEIQKNERRLIQREETLDKKASNLETREESLNNKMADLTQKEKPHRGKKKVDFLEPAQAQRFIQCVAEEPLYWRCLLNILVTTGLRRGECVGLQWGDVDGEKLTISVSRSVSIDKDSPDKIHVGTTKTGEERVVPISLRLYALLQSFRREQEAKYQAALLHTAFIFCSESNPYLPIYPTTPTRYVAKFVKRHNLPNVSPHDLRHTAATLALESGADLKQVQELLGHRDASTTMQFYAGVTDEAKRRTVEGIESLIAQSDT